MWELTARTPAPRLAEAPAAVADRPAGRAFGVGPTGLMNRARSMLGAP